MRTASRGHAACWWTDPHGCGRDAERPLHTAEVVDCTADTADLRRHLETASGQDLERFFQQWLFQGGVPTVAATWGPDAGGGLRVTLRQTQPTVDFEVEVDVQFRFAGGTLSEIVTAEVPPRGTDASHAMSVPNPEEVVGLILDPNVRLLAAFDIREETGAR